MKKISDKNNGKKVGTGISLSYENYRWITEYAAKEGRSVNNVINRLIEEKRNVVSK